MWPFHDGHFFACLGGFYAWSGTKSQNFMCMDCGPHFPSFFAWGGLQHQKPLNCLVGFPPFPTSSPCGTSCTTSSHIGENKGVGLGLKLHVVGWQVARERGSLLVGEKVEGEALLVGMCTIFVQISITSGSHSCNQMIGPNHHKVSLHSSFTVSKNMVAI